MTNRLIAEWTAFHRRLSSLCVDLLNAQIYPVSPYLYDDVVVEFYGKPAFPVRATVITPDITYTVSEIPDELLAEAKRKPH